VGDESKVSFALVLFSGMIIHSLFSECLNRAPGIILNHSSYVTKVVFPLEILPLVALCSALLHFMVSLGLLLVFCVYSGMSLNFSIVYLPIIMIPLILMSVGFTLAISALGVYLRDINQIMGVITTVLMFLSPVFYKTSAFPDEYRTLFNFNPLTFPIEQLRNVILWNKPISWENWMITLVVGILICQFGFWWFQKSRKGFADVI
jgi:lipopolysaccharide transport system permease protein